MKSFETVNATENEKSRVSENWFEFENRFDFEKLIDDGKLFESEKSSD